MNYLKNILYTLITILIGTLIITILNYFNVLSGPTLKIISLIIPLIGVSLSSFLLGRKTTQKGYIEGLKYGMIWLLVLLTVNLTTKNFYITSIIYYIILLLLSILSGIIGINNKKN